MSELPVTPEGHILLLINIEGRKTFKDYSSIYNCLESTVASYEEYRNANDNEGSGGDLKDFQNWLDTKFEELHCFQYSREINRYKLVSKDDFKNLFDANDENESPKTKEPSATNGSNNPSEPYVTNGTSSGTVGSVFSTGAAADTRGWIPITNGTASKPMTNVTNGKTIEVDEDDDQLDYDDDEETWDG